jgi:hypothetical protein
MEAIQTILEEIEYQQQKINSKHALMEQTIKVGSLTSVAILFVQGFPASPQCTIGPKLMPDMGEWGRSGPRL